MKYLIVIFVIPDHLASIEGVVGAPLAALARVATLCSVTDLLMLFNLSSD